MKTLIEWRIFFILLALSLLSVVAIFPYVLTLQGDVIKQVNLPLHIIFLIQFFQSAVLFSVSLFVGLYLDKKVNFRMPLLDAFIVRKDYKKELRNIVSLSVLLGCVTAVTIYVVDYFFAMLGSSISTGQNLAPVWQKILAAFYGGITEEILMRLFLMTLFVWVGKKITKKNKPTQTVVISSLLLSAVIFGLGHLPITATLTKITPIIIARAVVLNGIGGIVFGWLYWKKGFEAAVIAHFTTDIFLLTILPIFLN